MQQNYFDLLFLEKKDNNISTPVHYFIVSFHEALPIFEPCFSTRPLYDERD